MSETRRVIKESDIKKLALEGMTAQAISYKLGVSLPVVYRYAPEGCYKKKAKVERTKILKDGVKRLKPEIKQQTKNTFTENKNGERKKSEYEELRELTADSFIDKPAIHKRSNSKGKLTSTKDSRRSD